MFSVPCTLSVSFIRGFGISANKQ